MELHFKSVQKKLSLLKPNQKRDRSKPIFGYHHKKKHI